MVTQTSGGLPSDIEVLDKARAALSDARDWLNSDTTDAIAGRRTRDTAAAIDEVMEAIGRAKAAIDYAKDGIYRGRVRS